MAPNCAVPPAWQNWRCESAQKRQKTHERPYHRASSQAQPPPLRSGLCGCQLTVAIAFHDQPRGASMRVFFRRSYRLPWVWVAVDGHRSTLLIQDVVDGGANLTRLPQIPGAAMMCPALAAACAVSIERSRCIRLELLHCFLRRDIRFDDDVDVVRADVRGVEEPVPNLRVATNGLQNY